MEKRDQIIQNSGEVPRVPEGDGYIVTRIKAAIEYAKMEKTIVYLEFNETPVIVSPGSDEAEVYMNWKTIRALHQKVTELEKRLKNR